MTKTLTDKSILPISGLIENATVVEHTCPRRIDEPLLIEDGDALDAPAGSAYFVQDDKKWLLVQFHRDGRLVGPMLAGRAKIEEPGAALHRLEDTRGPCMALGGLVLAFMAVVIGAFVFGASPEELSTATPWLLVLAGFSAIVACISFGRVRQISSIIAESGDAAIDLLTREAGAATYYTRTSEATRRELIA